MQRAGHLARSNARVGFTLLELLVVIAIIVLLAAILFPVFATVRENSRKTACLSNEKQIGLGLLQYTQDYDEMGPRESFGTFNSDPTLNTQYVWMDATIPYVKSVSVYTCPSHVFARNTGPVSSTYVTQTGITRINLDGTHLLSYGINRNYYLGVADPDCPVASASCPETPNQPRASNPFSSNTRSIRLSQIARPGETVLLTDNSVYVTSNPWTLSTDMTVTDGSGNSPHIYRHLGLTNVLMCDGHVKTMRRSQLTVTHDVPNLNGVGTTPVYYLFTIQED
jgi:prepilin-type N-terminal cleavage/methylation domain-containing protein/prepilin-type processing-associated H-X9-DG protein